MVQILPMVSITSAHSLADCAYIFWRYVRSSAADSAGVFAAIGALTLYDADIAMPARGADESAVSCAKADVADRIRAADKIKRKVVSIVKGRCGKVRTGAGLLQ